VAIRCGSSPEADITVVQIHSVQPKILKIRRFSMSSSMIGIIVLGVIAVLVIPMILGVKKTMKSAAGARNFGGDFCRMTGLTQGADSFTGTYKGHSFRVKSEMGADYMQMVQMRGVQIFPKLTVTLTSPGGGFPHTVLREEHGILVETNQRINNMITGDSIPLPPEVPELKKRLPRIGGVYSDDQGFAEKIVSDQELSRLLDRWYYADIRIQGDTVELVLNHENAPRHFGTRMASPQYWVEAMDICVRVAESARA
jgi:hypothetical protein